MQPGMEQGNNQPHITPEVSPASKDVVSPETGERRIEQTPERGALSPEQAAERAAAPAEQQRDLGGFAPSMPAPLSAPSVSGAQQSDGTFTSDLTASDNDLIEKEWVDKTKSTIELTQGNPYKREELISDIKQDYQKKRFGTGADGR